MTTALIAGLELVKEAVKEVAANKGVQVEFCGLVVRMLKDEKMVEVGMPLVDIIKSGNPVEFIKDYLSNFIAYSMGISKNNHR